jgi:hypothetical protein
VLASLILPTIIQPQAESSPKALNLTVGDIPAVPRAPQPLVPVRKEPEPPDYLAIKKASDERLAAEEKARQEAEAAEAARLEALRLEQEAQLAASTPAPAGSTFAAPVQATVVVYGNYLSGSYGYALAGGNCVVEPGVNNPGWGNPIDWPITNTEPWIGASALFWYNHVAVVTGLWGNGDIEVRHQNCPGCPTRYSRASFRGFR